MVVLVNTSGKHQPLASPCLCIRLGHHLSHRKCCMVWGTEMQFLLDQRSHNWDVFVEGLCRIEAFTQAPMIYSIEGVGHGTVAIRFFSQQFQ